MTGKTVLGDEQNEKVQRSGETSDGYGIQDKEGDVKDQGQCPGLL